MNYFDFCNNKTDNHYCQAMTFYCRSCWGKLCSTYIAPYFRFVLVITIIPSPTDVAEAPVNCEVEKHGFEYAPMNSDSE